MAKRESREVEVWERRADLKETPKAYERFCAYRDMERPLPRSTRSLKECAKALGVSCSNLEQLSVKYQWVARARAYDDYMERRVREENEAEIIDMKRKHALLAQSLLAKATKRLLTLPEDEIGAKDIVMMVDTGVKVERLSRGESTENKQVRGDIRNNIKGEIQQHHNGAVAVTESPIDLTKLTEEELDDLERLCAKVQEQPPDG